MPQFSQEFVDRVRTAIDIVELISQDVKLMQRGKNYVGLCPFHEEKTPSFSVSREEQLFYCFGCGVGGNVYNYVMNIHHISFPEAVEMLAKKAGIALPSVSPKQRRNSEKAETLFKINRLAAEYYYRMLRAAGGAQARQYLASRGIDLALARSFYLGYAPDAWDGLIKFLQASGEQISLELVAEAGLIIKGKNGYYDRFRNRVIFPICDVNKHFIGFGGRVIGDGEPKYLNTPETMIFHKGRTLYGLNWAKDAIKHYDYIVIVEGYTDCISLYARGIMNTAASLGTSFTMDHAQLISRFTRNVIIAFDGDTAGIKATQRGIELLKKAGLNVRIAPLPAGYDPDTFARSHSTEEVRSWLEGALPYLQYQINTKIRQYDLSSPEGKITAAKEIINILSTIQSAIEREEYSNYAAQLLSVDKQIIEAELEQVVQTQREEKLKQVGNQSHINLKDRYTIKDLRRKHVKPQIVFKVNNQSENIENTIMRLLITNPSYIEEMVKLGLDAASFSNADYQHLFTLLQSGAWDKQGESVAERLFQLPEPTGKWSDYLHSFRKNVWYRHLSYIEEKLSFMENHKQSDVFLHLCQLLKQYAKLRREIILDNQKN